MFLRVIRVLTVAVTVLGLAGAGPASLAAPKEKNPHQNNGGPKDAKPGKAKGHQHLSGKDLVGDKIKQNGKHKFHTHGKFAASVNVTNGKIAGVSVTHADRGDVPVTKYKTNKKMARGPSSGIQLASYSLVQDSYIDTVWIGYSYIDDYGEEIIYWFPYDMILDGDTGAIEYVPADY